MKLRYGTVTVIAMLKCCSAVCSVMHAYGVQMQSANRKCTQKAETPQR